MYVCSFARLVIKSSSISKGSKNLCFQLFSRAKAAGAVEKWDGEDGVSLPDICLLAVRF